MGTTAGHTDNLNRYFISAYRTDKVFFVANNYEKVLNFSLKELSVVKFKKQFYEFPLKNFILKNLK